MIGLGVGIDYALFIVTRHRQHLHEGMSVEDSAGTAIATAGQAVLFAGTTVVIAILGLFLAGLPGHQRDGRRRWRWSSPSRWPPRSRCSPACSAWPARRSTSSRSTASRTSTKPAARDALRPLGPPRRQPPGALRDREPRRAVRHRRSGAQHAHRHTRRRQRRRRTRRSAPPTTSWPHGFGPGSTARSKSSSSCPSTGRPRRPSTASTTRCRPIPASRAVTAPVFNAAGDTAVLTANPTTVAAGRDAPTSSSATSASDVLPATVAGHRTRRCRSPARRWPPT